MAHFDNHERKQRIKQWKVVEHAALAASMPITPEQLNSLLDYLDANLNSCDHTTKLTGIFLDGAELGRNRVLSWLAEQGGFCDCEVLANLEDLADSFRERPIRSKAQPKEQRCPRNLSTNLGWDFTALPQPWRVANLYMPAEPLQLQMGKKGGCTITIVESAIVSGNQMSDAYWSKLWYARTKLPKKSPIVVSHGTLDLPGHLQSTVVQTSGWIPVFCWIGPKEEAWYLEVRTELNRQQGDLPQVAKLVTQLETDEA